MQDGTEKTFIENQANAKLIAIAPELLHAANEAHELIDMMILSTPTGKLRNKLCDANIKLMSVIDKAI